MHMDSEKAKSILPLDYDEDDSEEEEDDDELFENSKVDWRVKGNLLRGKEFTVSDNGNCPRCQSNIMVFVILDELFPMGDMPEILYNLLAKGKAVLWSSQDKQTCKKPPTFMCKGFCPADPLGAGFNINWDTVNLTKLLKDLLKLNIAKAQKKMMLAEKAEEDDEDNVDEQDLIRVMLAKEKEKGETEERAAVDGKPKNDAEVGTSTSALMSTASAPEIVNSATAAVSNPTVATSPTATDVSPTSTESTASNVEYPVSKDGSCPYCASKDVRYIILVKDSAKVVSLPPTLDKLLKLGKAFKMAKGANNPPSFQCCTCTYGFNLDWSCNNLQKIFDLDEPAPAEVTTAAVSSTTSVAYQYPSFPPPSYPPPGLQNSGYAPYGYHPMYYPTAPSAYGYPTPGYGVPPHGMPHMQTSPPFAGNVPLRSPPPSGYPPHGGPPPPGYPTYRGLPHPGFRPPVGYPQPGFRPPGGPQMYGIPPRSPSMVPDPGYGNSYGQLFPADYNQQPSSARPPPGVRLRIPTVTARGRHVNHSGRKGRWLVHTTYYGTPEQWSGYTEEQHGNEEEEEGTTEGDYDQQVVDPAAANRFEELLNKIDEKTGENVDDEKPPGEESQAEFEVTAYSTVVENTPVENTTVENTKIEQETEDKNVNESNSEKLTEPYSEVPCATNITNSVSNVASEQPVKGVLDNISSTDPKLPKEVPSNEIIPEEVPVSSMNETGLEEPGVHQGESGDAKARPADVSGNEENQNRDGKTSEMESQESEVAESSLATKSRKTTTRSRKRQPAGSKKKTGNARGGKRKKVEKEPEEKEVEEEEAGEADTKLQNNEDNLNEGAKDKQEDTKPDTTETVEEEAPQPYRRVTRARAQKAKS